MSKFPIVLVNWVDSSGDRDGWISTELALKQSTDEAMACQSAGFLIAETETFVVISDSTLQDHHVYCPMQIPKVAIVSIRVLTGSKPHLWSTNA